jgi:hypothetical protein
MAETRDALLKSVRQSFEKGLAIIEKKNHDYGANADPFKNFRSVELLGLPVEKGILVRMLDKLARLNNLLDHEAYVTDESFEDTAIDLQNYAAILRAFRELNPRSN